MFSNLNNVRSFTIILSYRIVSCTYNAVLPSIPKAILSTPWHNHCQQRQRPPRPPRLALSQRKKASYSPKSDQEQTHSRVSEQHQPDWLQGGLAPLRQQLRIHWCTSTPNFRPPHRSISRGGNFNSPSSWRRISLRVDSNRAAHEKRGEERIRFRQGSQLCREDPRRTTTMSWGRRRSKREVRWTFNSLSLLR